MVLADCYSPYSRQTQTWFLSLNFVTIVLALIAVANAAVARHLGDNCWALLWCWALAVTSAVSSFMPPFHPVEFF